jgi:hypothetical protein
MGQVDQAIDGLNKALVNVRAHQRRTKGGKVAQVRAHTANVNKRALVAAMASQMAIEARAATAPASAPITAKEASDFIDRLTDPRLKALADKVYLEHRAHFQGMAIPDIKAAIATARDKYTFTNDTTHPVDTATAAWVKAAHDHLRVNRPKPAVRAPKPAVKATPVKPAAKPKAAVAKQAPAKKVKPDAKAGAAPKATKAAAKPKTTKAAIATVKKQAPKPAPEPKATVKADKAPPKAAVKKDAAPGKAPKLVKPKAHTLKPEASGAKAPAEGKVKRATAKPTEREPRLAVKVDKTPGEPKKMSKPPAGPALPPDVDYELRQRGITHTGAIANDKAGKDGAQAPLSPGDVVKLGDDHHVYLGPGTQGHHVVLGPFGHVIIGNSQVDHAGYSVTGLDHGVSPDMGTPGTYDGYNGAVRHGEGPNKRGLGVNLTFPQTSRGLRRILMDAGFDYDGFHLVKQNPSPRDVALAHKLVGTGRPLKAAAPRPAPVDPEQAERTAIKAANTAAKDARANGMVNAPKRSGHIGVPGAPVTGKFKLLEEPRPITNAWGTSYLHKFTDEQGNLASWFSPKPTGLKPGTTYDMSAKVKAHKEFKGVKETQLTYAEIHGGGLAKSVGDWRGDRDAVVTVPRDTEAPLLW